MVRREFTVANEHAYDRRSPVRWIVSHILRYPHLPLIAVLGNVATSGLYSVGSILIGRAFDLVAAPGATFRSSLPSCTLDRGACRAWQPANQSANQSARRSARRALGPWVG